MKVVFCAAEVFPFAKTGGLGDVCGALPLALEKKGVEVSIVLPRYKTVSPRQFALKRLKEDIFTTTLGRKIRVFLLENKPLFGRHGIYGYNDNVYHDNLERFQYLCRRTIDLLRELNLKTDIIHCHDWHAALLPVYLKTIYKGDSFYRKTKSILTIHNLAYQGVFSKREFSKLDLDGDSVAFRSFEFNDQINLLKAGIVFCDWVTTVSPQYAREIRRRDLGFGLDETLRKKHRGVFGILNGIDYDVWDPQEDPFIWRNYSFKTLKDKYVNKRKLQKAFQLDVSDETPLFGFVGRMTAQKGLDLIFEAAQDMVAMDVQMVFLGTGEEKYHRLVRTLSKRFPKNIAVAVSHDETWAHRIYAASDFFLMPSYFEPCGLSQMISLRYGTIPLVYATGGLKDTITAFDVDRGQGNGFVFTKYTPEAFAKAMKKAVAIFRNKRVFKRLIHRAFGYDFSWEKSAQEYLHLYRQCLSLD